MKAYALEMLEPLNIDFYYHSEGMDPHLRFRSIIRQNTLFIFKEAINNIVKHANAKEVHVYFNRTMKGFRLTIVDDGEGFSYESDREEGYQI